MVFSLSQKSDFEDTTGFYVVPQIQEQFDPFLETFRHFVLNVRYNEQFLENDEQFSENYYSTVTFVTDHGLIPDIIELNTVLREIVSLYNLSVTCDWLIEPLETGEFEVQWLFKLYTD